MRERDRLAVQIERECKNIKEIQGRVSALTPKTVANDLLLDTLHERVTKARMDIEDEKTRKHNANREFLFGVWVTQNLGPVSVSRELKEIEAMLCVSSSSILERHRQDKARKVEEEKAAIEAEFRRVDQAKLVAAREATRAATEAAAAVNLALEQEEALPKENGESNIHIPTANCDTPSPPKRSAPDALFTFEESIVMSGSVPIKPFAKRRRMSKDETLSLFEDANGRASRGSINLDGMTSFVSHQTYPLGSTTSFPSRDEVISAITVDDGAQSISHQATEQPAVHQQVTAEQQATEPISILPVASSESEAAKLRAILLSGGGRKRSSTTLSQDNIEMEEGEIQGEITTDGAAGAGALVRASDVAKTMQSFGLSVDADTMDRARMLSNAMKQITSGGGNHQSMGYPYYAPQGASPFMMPPQNGGNPYMMPPNMMPNQTTPGYAPVFPHTNPYLNPFFQHAQQQQGGRGQQPSFNPFYQYPRPSMPYYPPH